jgi:hypothetical protein
VEDLIVVIVQFTFEVIVSAFAGAPFGFCIRKPSQPESSSAGYQVVFALAGGLLGYASAYLLPFKILPYSWLRLLNLVVAPVAGGYVAKTIATRRAKADPLIEPNVHFWNAFWFILPFALLRLAYVARYAI